MKEDRNVIEPAELAEQVGAGNSILLDCRFSLLQPMAGRQSFDAAHLPGARYVHLDHDLAATPRRGQGRHPLPTAAAFAATLGRLGIQPDSHVTAYDDAGGAIAARLWWMLRWLGHARVSVLNGGIQAWEAGGLDLESAAPQWSEARYDYTSANDTDWVRTEDLPQLLAQGSELVDVRAAKRFLGHEEPIDPVAGHVPGAVNLPFNEMLGADGRFLEPIELRDLLRRRLSRSAGPETIAMCGSGVTACHLLLALAHAGLPRGRLYAGSWSEWITDPSRPVAGEDR